MTPPARAAALLAFALSASFARPAHAQQMSDDPYAPRNSVTYMSSDFVRQLAHVRTFQPSPRTEKDRLPMGDVRFGASPSLHFSRNTALLADGGVAARFLLDHSHLASVDWIILGMVTVESGLPRIAKNVLCDVGSTCSLKFGAGVRHLSAHGGDEFMQVEKQPFLIYSRDGYVARVAMETSYIGGRFEVNDDVRTYGLYPSTEVMGELWLRPFTRSHTPVLQNVRDFRIGAVSREIPGVSTSYEAVYSVLPFRVSNQRFELRGRLTRGGVPIGYAYGSVEHSAQLELVVR